LIPAALIILALAFCPASILQAQPWPAAPPQIALFGWIRACALHYGVDPEFAFAVAIVESRPKGGSEFEIRIGPMGKNGRYIGPMGISKCFAKKYDIYNVWENIRVGIKALNGNERKALKRYNDSFNEAYYTEVMRIKYKLQHGGNHDIKLTSRNVVDSNAAALTITKPIGRFRQ